MRAVVLRSHGGPEVLTIEEVDAPTPGRDDVVVDVAHTAVNRADILQRMGMYPDPRNHAVEIPGLEYSGVVAAVGADVTGWSIGDRVMGIESGGCYAEQVVTHARQALPVPAGVESADAAAIPEVFLTAWDALVVQGGLTSGRWALVHAGASGVGTAGDPDREGGRGAHRCHVLGGQGRRLPCARRRCRARAQSIRLARSTAVCRADWRRRGARRHRW
jgi:NADPH:quinone reductase-like Zn-dependent oxidoreductase